MPLKDIKNKALVTGGAGFIGSRLVQALLENGVSVRVLDCQLGPFRREGNPKLEFVGVGADEFHSGMVDMSMVQQVVRDVDVVYHLAINWDGHTWKHRLPLNRLFEVNVRGTLNLLEAARSQGVKHFLYSSSCAVYGSQGSRIVDEETACKPELWDGDPGPAYGILKLTIERLCLLYHYQHGLAATAFRIDFVFNDDDALPSSRILENVRKGETVEVARGDGYCSIHVDEVVQAFLAATLNERAYGEVFNLSNPATFITYRELYQTLIKSMRSNSMVKLSHEQARIGRAVESIEKIQKALGWKPIKTKKDLKEAIIRSVEHV
jgi:nucleoside-diphosphate-sugar epimerase